MPRKPGSDGSDTALFDMLRSKLFDGSKSKPTSRRARGATAPRRAASPAAPTATASSRTPTRSSGTATPSRVTFARSQASEEGPRRMTAAERKANATRKEPVASKRTPKVTVQEAPPARPAKPMKSPRRFGNMDEESFGKAFAHYRKAGAKTFTWRGKSYTTKTKEEV